MTVLFVAIALSNNPTNTLRIRRLVRHLRRRAIRDHLRAPRRTERHGPPKAAPSTVIGLGHDEQLGVDGPVVWRQDAVGRVHFGIVAGRAVGAGVC